MKKGITLLEIFIFIGVIALISSLLAQHIINSRVRNNEKRAYAVLKTIISTALENYAKEHNGQYPSREADLLSANQSYLNRHYNGRVVDGYSYNLELSLSGYNVVVAPVFCGQAGSGTKIYVLTTGGTIQESDCSPGINRK